MFASRCAQLSGGKNKVAQKTSMMSAELAANDSAILLRPIAKVSMHVKAKIALPHALTVRYLVVSHLSLVTSLLRNTAVKNEITIPMIQVVAKPRIGPVPVTRRITPVMRVSAESIR